MTGPGGADTSPVRVLLVDDHDLLAQPLAIALRLRGLQVDIAPLTSAAHVVEAAEQGPADLVLLDLDLGGAIGDGASLVPGLAAAGCRVIIVTGSPDPVAAGLAVERGAIGVVYKHHPFDRLVSTVVSAAHGHAVMDLDQRRTMVQATRVARRQRSEVDEQFDRLSDREAQVLRALADGRSVAEIARGWVVSEATVRTQVRGVLTKLGVSTQLAAVAHAHRSGWLEARAS